MLTWWLLNENDTNEINTDSTRSFVITHCLCSVLKVESLYSFSPTIGKQACFAHDLSKKFQIFAAVHKSNVLNSATKLILSNLSPNLSAYGMIFRLLGLLNTNISHGSFTLEFFEHEELNE